MDRPHVTLKLATSLDGRIATASGHSKWITGELARAEVHKMRAAVDAVIIGIGTALADDPELTARTDPPPVRQPLRVVLDRALRLPVASNLVRTAATHTILVISTGGWPQSSPLFGRAGVECMCVRPKVGEGDIAAVLRALSQHHRVRRILVEGGGVVAGAFLREGLVDRLEWFRAPIVLGGDGRPAIGELGLTQLADACAWKRVALRELGPDLWESYERA